VRQCENFYDDVVKFRDEADGDSRKVTAKYQRKTTDLNAVKIEIVYWTLYLANYLS